MLKKKTSKNRLNVNLKKLCQADFYAVQMEFKDEILNGFLTQENFSTISRLSKENFEIISNSIPLEESFNSLTREINLEFFGEEEDEEDEFEKYKQKCYRRLEFIFLDFYIDETPYSFEELKRKVEILANCKYEIAGKLTSENPNDDVIIFQDGSAFFENVNLINCKSINDFNDHMNNGHKTLVNKILEKGGLNSFQ